MKKAQLLMYGLIIGLLLALGIAYFATLEVPIPKRYLGQNQLAVLKTAAVADSVTLYIDQSAKLAAQEAAYDLAAKGGLSASQCGDYAGYSMWNSKDSVCFPSNPEEDYLQFFEAKLDDYLLKVYATYNIPPANYELTIEQDKVIGASRKMIELTIYSKDASFAELHPTTPTIKDAQAPTPQGDFVKFTQWCQDPDGCMLKKEAYDLLEKTEKDVQGSIVVTSAYRTLEEQKKIWDSSTLPEDKRRKMICLPYQDDPEKHCPHLTGYAVDVRFNTQSMSSDDWAALERVMTKNGWVRYAVESWHFECCQTERYSRAQKEGKTVIG